MGKQGLMGEWVAVEDALPKEGKEVLTFSTMKGSEHYGKSTGFYDLAFLEDGNWFYSTDATMIEKQKITHWMAMFPPAKSAFEGKADLEVEKVWNDFWASVVLNPDGSVNVDQVKKELYDFHTCIEEVTKVYGSITNGRFSKPTTMAAYVIDAVNSQIQEGIRMSEPWIRVEDGLPDEDIEVEAYMEVSDNFEIAARAAGRWYQVGSEVNLHGISHWRDLVGPVPSTGHRNGEKE